MHNVLVHIQVEVNHSWSELNIFHKGERKKIQTHTKKKSVHVHCTKISISRSSKGERGPRYWNVPVLSMEYARKWPYSDVHHHFFINPFPSLYFASQQKSPQHSVKIPNVSLPPSTKSERHTRLPFGCFMYFFIFFFPSNEGDVLHEINSRPLYVTTTTHLTSGIPFIIQ